MRKASGATLGPAFRKTPQNDFAKDHDAISFP